MEHGIAIIVGTSDLITPKATLDASGPAFPSWMALCGCAFLFFGFETGNTPIAMIDRALERPASARPGSAAVAFQRRKNASLFK